MAGTLRRPRRSQPSYRKKNPIANKPQPTAGISVVSATPAASILTVVFNQPIRLKGTPNYTTDVAGAVPVSAALISPTTIEVTFDVAIATATVVNIPYEDPAVRGLSGGFVTPTTFPV